MSFDHLLILTNHGKLLTKAGRHRNDTRKDTRLHCSDFSALKNPTTYSDTRSSPLLHLQHTDTDHSLRGIAQTSVTDKLRLSAEETGIFFQTEKLFVKNSIIFCVLCGTSVLSHFLLLGGTSSILRTFWGGTSRKKHPV